MAEEKTSKENSGKVFTPQKGLQEFIVKSDVDIMFCGGSMSSGKDQPLDSKILTPRGWVENKDLKIGDKVCTPFNGIQTISAIFPQGEKDVYELETFDGRKCECGLEHLWEVRTTKQVHNFRKYRERKNFSVITTQELIQALDDSKTLFLQLPDAQEFPEKEYLIHPYVLGMLIGDGCLTLVDNKTCFEFSNAEEDIIQKVYNLSGGVRLYRHPCAYTKYIWTEKPSEVNNEIKRLGLNVYSGQKFIPEEYLWGSIQQRKDLLAGLFDSDGYVAPSGAFSITTTSERLKNDIIRLVRSLGYYTSEYEDKRTEKYTTNHCYQIFIRTDDPIFTSAKHTLAYQKFLESTDRKYARTNDHVRIKSVKFKRRTQTQCIYINDRDHLYITDDFIVTHNTFGMILALAEPIQDPNFRAVFLRRNLAETKTGGGMFDDCKKVYADYIKSAKESDNPRITFNSGAFVEFTHISDETPEKLLERIRGWQFSLILLDEGTSFEWSTFRLLMSRNRSTAKWTNKIRLTCNPKKRHWLRTFLKDYIGPDGFIKPDWDGRVRYLYIKGKNVEDVVWGDTKEEVYAQCKYQIDEAVRKFNEKGGNVDYRAMIKSFTFYLGSPAENKAMIGTNSSYLGSVAAMGEAEARANLLGNWNVDLDEDDEAPLKRADIEAVFDTDPQRNNDRWITMDLADTGTDNTLILVWDGFHIIDYKILMKSTPRQNAECVEMMASKHSVGDGHIIYDGVRAAYMLDYIPDAVAYISYRAPLGKYGRMAENLKTECYLRLVEMVKRGRISFDDQVAMSVYQHQNMGVPILFKTEFSEECSVIRFIDLPSGRKRIANKKDMNKMLGKGRSMDLCDPIAMRMMPALGYEYGTELESTFCDDSDPDEITDSSVDIYDEATWS